MYLNDEKLINVASTKILKEQVILLPLAAQFWKQMPFSYNFFDVNWEVKTYNDDNIMI